MKIKISFVIETAQDADEAVKVIKAIKKIKEGGGTVTTQDGGGEGPGNPKGGG